MKRQASLLALGVLFAASTAPAQLRAVVKPPVVTSATGKAACGAAFEASVEIQNENTLTSKGTLVLGSNHVAFEVPPRVKKSFKIGGPVVDCAAPMANQRVVLEDASGRAVGSAELEPKDVTYTPFQGTTGSTTLTVSAPTASCRSPLVLSAIAKPSGGAAFDGQVKLVYGTQSSLLVLHVPAGTASAEARYTGPGLDCAHGLKTAGYSFSPGPLGSLVAKSVVYRAVH